MKLIFFLGRSVEETKDFLNTLILALHEVKRNESHSDRSFTTVNFLDRVILDPVEVAPDGLFEKDMVLSREQTLSIFKSRFLGVGNFGNEKTLAVSKWPLPILYTFDGAHCMRIEFCYLNIYSIDQTIYLIFFSPH